MSVCISNLSFCFWWSPRCNFAAKEAEAPGREERWWEVTFPALPWWLNDSCCVTSLCQRAASLNLLRVGEHACTSEHVQQGCPFHLQHIASLLPSWQTWKGLPLRGTMVTDAPCCWWVLSLDTISIFNGMFSILLSLPFSFNTSYSLTALHRQNSPFFSVQDGSQPWQQLLLQQYSFSSHAGSEGFTSNGLC